MVKNVSLENLLGNVDSFNFLRDVDENLWTAHDNGSELRFIYKSQLYRIPHQYMVKVGQDEKGDYFTIETLFGNDKFYIVADAPNQKFFDKVENEQRKFATII